VASSRTASGPVSGWILARGDRVVLLDHAGRADPFELQDFGEIGEWGTVLRFTEAIPTTPANLPEVHVVLDIGRNRVVVTRPWKLRQLSLLEKIADAAR